MISYKLSTFSDIYWNIHCNLRLSLRDSPPGDQISLNFEFMQQKQGNKLPEKRRNLPQIKGLRAGNLTNGFLEITSLEHLHIEYHYKLTRACS